MIASPAQTQPNHLMAMRHVSSAGGAALGGLDCPHYGDISLRTLRPRVAIIQGDKLAQQVLPHSSSAIFFEPRRTVPQVRDIDLSGSGDELAPAHCPRTSNPLLQAPFQCTSWPPFSTHPLMHKM